jgi:hypothetical protein
VAHQCRAFVSRSASANSLQGASRLLIGYYFEVLLKVLLRDHVDRGNELAVVVVGPIGKLGEFNIAAPGGSCENG